MKFTGEAEKNSSLQRHVEKNYEITTGARHVEKNYEIPPTGGTLAQAEGGRIEYGEIGWSAVFTTEVHEWSHADDGDFVLREPLLSLCRHNHRHHCLPSLTKSISSATHLLDAEKLFVCLLFTLSTSGPH